MVLSTKPYDYTRLRLWQTILCWFSCNIKPCPVSHHIIWRHLRVLYVVHRILVVGTGVCGNTLLLREPWPGNPAETEIQPQIWCFQSWFSNRSSYPEVVLFTDTGITSHYAMLHHIITYTYPFLWRGLPLLKVQATAVTTVRLRMTLSGLSPRVRDRDIHLRADM